MGEVALTNPARENLSYLRCQLTAATYCAFCSLLAVAFFSIVSALHASAWLGSTLIIAIAATLGRLAIALTRWRLKKYAPIRSRLLSTSFTFCLIPLLLGMLSGEPFMQAFAMPFLLSPVALCWLGASAIRGWLFNRFSGTNDI